MLTQIKNNRGFTLWELMIAIAILSIFSVSIYRAYLSQLKAKITQDQVVDMQQTLRGAMTILQKEIRMAAFDPEDTGNAGFIAGFPTAASMVGPGSFAIAFDDDGDGVVAVNDQETIAYRFNNNRLERFFNSTGTWEALAENIDAVSFVYLDGNGNPIDDDGAGNVTTNLNQIRSVEITLVGRAGEDVAAMTMKHTDDGIYYNRQGAVILDKSASPDGFRRRMMTAEVVCRNLLMD